MEKKVRCGFRVAWLIPWVSATGMLVVVALSVNTANAVTVIAFNTGVDNSGTVLAGGSVDPHYKLILSPDSGFPGPSTFVVSTSPAAWFANSSSSKWIAPRSDQDTATNSSWGNAPGDYTYRTTFDLTGFDPTTARVNGEWATDNVGLDILINGTSTGLSDPGPGYVAFKAFSIDNGFVTGTNTLDFIVHNVMGSNPNPTGFRAELRVSAAPLPAAPTLSLPALMLLVVALTLTAAISLRRVVATRGS